MNIRPPRSFAPRHSIDALAALDEEIAEERAATLGRLTQAFEQTLAAFIAFAPEPGEDEDSIAARREGLRQAAAEALWNFVVQREACGFRNTDAVLREYRVPPSLRLRMGARRA